jgi:SAM-dependent methyltransferase
MAPRASLFDPSLGASRTDPIRDVDGARPPWTAVGQPIDFDAVESDSTLISGGRRGVTERLREFTAEFPYERMPILDFVLEVASSCRDGDRVLDLGAGNAPYRELFAHTDYLTADWTESPHAGAQRADIIARADALPIRDNDFDLILCTQVLEHVPEPRDVLSECFRALRTGGSMALTAPLFWDLHELPHDYYRYTEAGLRHLVTTAGFVDVEISPRGDSFHTIAQLLRNLCWRMGRAPDGLNDDRARAMAGLVAVADEIAQLGPLDVECAMPLGYTLTGRKPDAPQPW